MPQPFPAVPQHLTRRRREAAGPEASTRRHGGPPAAATRRRRALRVAVLAGAGLLLHAGGATAQAETGAGGALAGADAVPASPVPASPAAAGAGEAAASEAGDAAKGGAAAGAADADAASSAAATGLPTLLSRATIRRAQRRLRIAADGRLGPATRAALRRFQRRHHLHVDGRLQPATLAALGITAGRAAAAPPLPAEVARLLQAIAGCESGGDPTRVSPDGRHRGKYQFLASTWAAVGGIGDPAAAPEAEQDQRAAALLAEEGTRPWPVCGPKAEAAA